MADPWPAMFLASDSFDTTGDIPELCERIDKLMEFRCLKPAASHNQQIGRYHEALLMNGCSARASILMHMRLTDVFDFFDTPSLDDMFRFLADSPQKCIQHLSPRISQSLTLLLTRIHNDLDRFASLASKYFASDMSLILIFSYSTFPALFGFFTLDYFCERGGYFIAKMMEDEKMTTAVSGMISAYFFSMYAFFDVLWTDFVQRLGQDRSLENCQEAFLVSLDKSAVLLTQSHAHVVSLYLNRNICACTRCVFCDIFAASLRLRVPSLESFVCFLESCASDGSVLCSYAERIFRILTKTRDHISKVPPVPPFDDLRRLPFAMSDRDIVTICEIEERANIVDAKELFNALPTLFKRGYSPFCVELVNPTRNTTRQPKRELTEEERNDNRNMSNICSLASDTGTSVVSWLAETPFFTPRVNAHVPEFCRSPHFNKIALVHEIKAIEDSISQTCNVIDLMERVQELHSYGKFIETTYKRLLDKFADTYVASLIPQVKVSKKNLMSARLECYFNAIFKSIDGRLALPACFAVLDAETETYSKEMRSYERKFRTFASSIDVSNRVGQWAAEYPHLAKKTLPLRTKCEALFQLPLGSRLRGMIKLAELINRISGAQDEHWQFMFESMLSFCGKVPIFGSFVVWTRFVFINLDVVTLITNQDKMILTKLLASFATLLRVEGSRDLYNAFSVYTNPP